MVPVDVRGAQERVIGIKRRAASLLNVLRGEQGADARERALADRLAVTLEAISDAFFTLDRQWRFTFVNGEAEKLLQRPRDELIGHGIWDEFPEAVGTDTDVAYAAAMGGTASSFETWYPPLQQWFAVNAYPSPDGIAVYFRSTTQRRLLEDQLRQSQRLEAIGQLTGGVAHDFNNLLTVILGNVEALALELREKPEQRQLAEAALAAAHRGAELTRHLLAFSRQQPLAPRAVEVDRLVGSMKVLLERTLGEHIALETRHNPETWSAIVDPGQLEGAILNLAINARDAMPDGGRLTIESSNIELDSDYAGQHTDPEPGSYVLVAVSDTGTGIAPGDLARVFDPFFTTKAVGEGTGLGLSMVYGFVKQSGGNARIYSEPGHGTTVRLYLPRADTAEEPMESRVVPDLVGGTELILVVEDDDLVREFVTGALGRLGYRVIVASNGPAALDLVRARDDIDLLFTDVIMPGEMNVRALAEAVVAIRPSIRVLYTSGYTEDAIVHQGRLDIGVHLLSKPYPRADLARAVRDALDA